MFSCSDETKIEFLERACPEGCIDCVDVSTPPKCVVGKKSGPAVVMQMVESFRYRTSGYSKCKDENIQKLYDSACMLDREILGRSVDFPTIPSVMQSCLDLGYVRNCKIAYAKDIETLKYLLDQYKSVVVELKLTSTTKNAHDFEISDYGDVMRSDCTKGFVLYRMADDYVLVQNSLGVECGVLGFNKIKMEAFKRLFVKGTCFVVEEEI